MPTLSGYIHIRDNQILLNGKLLFSAGNTPFAAFAELWYRSANINYPKFHKMDNLCKLGFMGADILLNNNQLYNNLPPFRKGVILANKNSSLDTDLRHHRQIQTGPASPAVFVYSLPNIVIGEICIRHGIKGENTFFIEPRFSPKHQFDYINLLFSSNKSDACLGGWVEFLNDEYELFMYVAVKDESPDGSLPFTAETLKNLYHPTL